jgi:hypothetical protein
MKQFLFDLAGFLTRSSALVGVCYLISVLWRRPGKLPVQWLVAAWFAPNLTCFSAYVPFLAGRLLGRRPALAVAAATTCSLLVGGYSWPGMVMQFVAAGLGSARLGPGNRAAAAIVAGLLAMLGCDVPDRPGLWLPAATLAGGPAGLLPMAYLWLGASLGSGLFLAYWEFQLREGEWAQAQAAGRILRLVQQSSQALRQGWSEQSAQGLAPLFREALAVGATFVTRNGQLLGFAGPAPHLHHPGCACHYSDQIVLDMADGAQLGLLSLPGAPFQAWTETVARGLVSILDAQQQTRALERARFDFLQAQIQPHFLFNTLNSVAALCTIEPARCRELVLQLADFLRHSLNHEGQQSSLAEELEVVRLYLAIEQVRFGERLQVKWDLPERLPERQMPAFLIQPLVENAVRHGLSPKESGGTVTLRVLEHSIVIEDDGVGCLGHTEGIGLSNVRQRLAGLGQLRLEPLASGGTRVEVEFLCAT